MILTGLMAAAWFLFAVGLGTILGTLLNLKFSKKEAPAPLPVKKTKVERVERRSDFLTNRIAEDLRENPDDWNADHQGIFKHKSNMYEIHDQNGKRPILVKPYGYLKNNSAVLNNAVEDWRQWEAAKYLGKKDNLEKEAKKKLQEELYEAAWAEAHGEVEEVSRNGIAGTAYASMTGR